jgi:hypothetical protein
MPAAVVAGVERVRRARSLTMSADAPVERARQQYLAQVAAYVDGSQDEVPDLAVLARASGEAAAAREAVELLRGAQSQADVDAAATLRGLAPAIVEDLRPRWQRVLDEAVKLTEKLPAVPNVSAIGADRDALLAWADLADAAAEHGRLSEARSRLWLLTHPQQWAPITDGRHVAQALHLAPVPADADQAGALLHLARVRTVIGLWWPADADMVSVGTTRTPELLEATRKGMRAVPTSDSEVW